MTERTIPQGFELVTRETEAAGYKYEVRLLQANGEGLESQTRTVGPVLIAILDAYAADGKNGEEVLAAIWNAANEQNAKQQKTAVRDAVEAAKAAGTDPGTAAAVAEAVGAHQTRTPGFLIGAPRGGGGKKHETGLTAKQRTEFGTAVALHMMRTGQGPTPEDVARIAQEIGFDPTLLAGDQAA